MKIFCIGKNYADHAKEMNSDVPTEPLIFMKPPTAILGEDKDLYYPAFTKNLHHEIEIILQICKNGKHIGEEFAHKYYDKVGLGIDFTARDLQEKFKNLGQPWELAKGFDGSAVIGKFKNKEEFDLKNIDFHLNKNGSLVQKGNTNNLIYSFENIISYISQFITLQKGDIIFTGTPAGVGAVKIGDKLVGYIGTEEFLEVEIK